MAQRTASVTLRDMLATLPAYRPGKAPDQGEVFKLSSNENPYPPLPGVIEAACEAMASANRYPDMFASDLAEAIARKYGVSPSQILTGPGSVGVLQQVVNAAAASGDEIVYAWRSFEAYPIVTAISGATPVEVPLMSDSSHDLAAMAEAVNDRTRLVLICNPNNPTGTAVDRREFEDFIVNIPDHVLVVMDEAYREFVRDPDVVDGLEAYQNRPNVCVLRTFSKAHGLAGLRVGFGIAHAEVADELRKTALPFGVSAVAQQAAIASLEREEELLTRVENLISEREKVCDSLKDQGWEIPHSEANFIWLPLGEETVKFSKKCEESGLIVRSFPGEGCRITVGEPEANSRLLQVTERWLSHKT